MNRTIRHVGLAGLLAVGLLAVPALGQGRNALQVRGLSAPGRLDTGVSTFSRYSYGLQGGGARPGGGAGGATGLTGRSYALQRSAGGAGTGMGSLGGLGGTPQVGTRQLYQPGRSSLDLGGSMNLGGGAGLGGAMPRLPGLGAPSGGAGLNTGLSPGATSFGAAGLGEGELPGMGAFGADFTTGAPYAELAQEQAIMSLAPGDGSRYDLYLSQGDAAFARGDYLEAMLQYRLADDVSRGNVLGLVGLVHASLALERYSTAAHYVGRVLAVEPDLPAAELLLRGFFGRPAEFIRIRDRVRQRATGGRLIVDSYTRDAEAQLVLAYMLWFDGQPLPAADALRAAARSSVDPQVTATVEAFWKAAVRTGRISGGLLADPVAASPTPGATP